jgi:hypothetical protein
VNKRFVAVGVVTAGLAAAAVIAMGAGAASAGGPYTWCPGMSMSGVDENTHIGGPGTAVQWNMKICHTWYSVNAGMGNVTGDVWDGDDPPPAALKPRRCPISFLCP